jgi:hypothetical protein
MSAPRRTIADYLPSPAREHNANVNLTHKNPVRRMPWPRRARWPQAI